VAVLGRTGPRFAAVALGLAVALAFAVPGAIGQADPAAQVSAAALPAVYQPSDTYTLTVNGVDVPVVGYPGYDYAQFSLGAGNARVAVTKLNRSYPGPALRPERHGEHQRGAPRPDPHAGQHRLRPDVAGPEHHHGVLRRRRGRDRSGRLIKVMH
jgi:hypothetical protein